MDEVRLEKFSYSKLDTFDQCKRKYKLKYIDKHRANESAMALEIGSIGHKGEEIKGRCLINGENPDYDYIENVVMNGIEEKTDKDNCFINGINQIKTKYFNEYFTKCNKTGMTYDEKLKIYFNNLRNKQMDKDWNVLAVEQHFEFIYNDRCIIHGFIDRIDYNSKGELRVLDYKTSKQIYKDDKIKTPLQMVIYALACKNLYGKIPIEFVYDFIFLGEEQYACSNGYLARGEKKLNKLLDSINDCVLTNEFSPNPTPLCYWCDYAKHTPLSSANTKMLCDYYLLWTPNCKNFNKNREYIAGGMNEIKNPFRF